MAILNNPGLGELLRHLSEMTDKGVEPWYKSLDFKYRPRYTPIMRAFEYGCSYTVNELTAHLAMTQGAVSQTIKLMIEDDLILKSQGEQDGRQAVIKLSKQGKEALDTLKPHWAATLSAIENLEREINYPIRNCLKSTVTALEALSFLDRIESYKPVNRQASTSTKPANLFQSGGQQYASFRPTYPQSLVKSLTSLVNQHDLAVDVGCGNGQLSTLLSPYFKQIIASDPSQNQLSHAPIKPNIRYLHETAEKIGITDNSADLIVAAQAAHWFDLELFYREARRIAKPGAVIALISYGVPYIADTVNSIFQQGYWQDIYQYWSPERKLVESGYSDIYFPFQQIPFSPHAINKKMVVDEFIRYLTTWSAYTNAKENGGVMGFENFFEKLRRAWGNNESKEVIWPIAVKAGHIN